jgi:hypothetical protein
MRRGIIHGQQHADPWLTHRRACRRAGGAIQLGQAWDCFPANLLATVGRAGTLSNLAYEDRFFLSGQYPPYLSLRPIAYELSRSHPELRVKLLVSHPPCVAQLRQLGADYTGHCCQIRCWPRLFVIAWPPACEPDFLTNSWFSKNLDYLSTFDAIVETELHGLKLKTCFGLASPKYILTGPVPESARMYSSKTAGD